MILKLKSKMFYNLLHHDVDDLVEEANALENFNVYSEMKTASN